MFIFVILAVANLALCQSTSESNPSNSSELDEGLWFISLWNKCCEPLPRAIQLITVILMRVCFYLFVVFFFLSLPSIKARTFGHHLFKRLSFAIIPTAFVVGVIMTLLAALTVVSIKGLGVGVMKIKN